MHLPSYRFPVGTAVFFILWIAYMLCCFIGCEFRQRRVETPVAQQRARQTQQWFKDAIIARVELAPSASGKTFQRLQQNLPLLKEAGFSVVWLSSIFPASSLYADHNPSDPFPVQDFYAVEDDLGTKDDFRSLVQAAHGQGLNIIIDLTITFTAWDSKLVMEHPDWFRTNDSGALVAPSPEWSDVADLNYDHHELRKYMIEVMKFWVQDANVDGFGSLNAELVPMDFWVRARKEVEKTHPVVLIAESDAPVHHLEGFDATFSTTSRSEMSEEYEKLESGTMGLLLEDEAKKFPQGFLRLRFTNPPSSYPQQRRTPAEKASREKLRAVFAFSLPGVPVKVFDERSLASLSMKSNRQFYESLATLRTKHPAIRHGAYADLPLPGQQNIHAFERKSQEERVLVLLNDSARPQEMALRLASQLRETLIDFLASKELTTSGQQLQITLAPFDAKIIIRTTKEQPQ